MKLRVKRKSNINATRGKACQQQAALQNVAITKITEKKAASSNIEMQDNDKSYKKRITPENEKMEHNNSVSTENLNIDDVNTSNHLRHMSVQTVNLKTRSGRVATKIILQKANKHVPSKPVSNNPNGLKIGLKENNNLLTKSTLNIRLCVKNEKNLNNIQLIEQSIIGSPNNMNKNYIFTDCAVNTAKSNVKNPKSKRCIKEPERKVEIEQENVLASKIKNIKRTRGIARMHSNNDKNKTNKNVTMKLISSKNNAKENNILNNKLETKTKTMDVVKRHPQTNIVSKKITKKTHKNEREQITGESNKKPACLSNKHVKFIVAKKIAKDKVLRPRRTQNYAELSQTESPKSTNVDYEPVYMRCSPPARSRKDENVYNFKDDPKNRSVSDDEFEDGMKSLIVALEKKTKHPLKSKRIKTPKKRVHSPNIMKENEFEYINISKDNISLQISNSNPVIELHGSDKDFLLSCSDVACNDVIHESGRHICDKDNIHDYDDLSYNDDVCESDDEFFKPASVINLLSEQQINKPTLNNNSILDVSFKNPGANSTFIGQASPWRLRVALKSTTRILATKKTNLPIYDQEMVINSSFLEQTGNVTLQKSLAIKTPTDINTPIKVIVSPKRRTKQGSILQFVSSGANVENFADENQLNGTLFDADKLSPIKRFSKSPKNILQEQNSQNHTPERQFGGSFEWSDDSFSMLKSSENIEHRNMYSKPMRLSFGEIKRHIPIAKNIPLKATNQVLNNNAENKIAKKNILEDEVFVKLPLALDSNYEGPSHGIFDDLESGQKMPKTTYERKRRQPKRVRYESACDEADEPVEHIKKRRKDIRTKEEELQAEKWATAFNRMCSEVENHTLDIE